MCKQKAKERWRNLAQCSLLSMARLHRYLSFSTASSLVSTAFAFGSSISGAVFAF